ncbi:glutamate 5-kinase [Thiomicrospira cyclica]|uniref:Glutamate 5-kinase n=1 Tax=Thiomicrospira cyclica (strain DSM 14477 / JCM 11371 / ALM1) TaxID=717773 RepID=F6D9I8_THICA|nr:glutamate 5-kinase [Thiomicrospira cyclica]AEG30945.1 Glutamate 5-kinase [Thiomicrospira cyclica ALM1]
MDRLALSQTRRWVIKLGSALLTNDGSGLNQTELAKWVAQMVLLRNQGVELIIVSSGAVAEGMQRLGWKTRPTALNELQAAAAVGQMGLVQAYESEFAKSGLHTAQILMTHDDLSNRARYLNARSTIQTLVEHGVIPVINENDTVVTDEIRFGDNDTLAALTANLIGADVLVILTDQQGLYDSNPRENPQAQLIKQAQVSRKDIEAMASPLGGALGRGGMYTKVMAAKRAARSGTATLIASGREADILPKLFAGEDYGTLLVPDLEPMTARKQWLAGHLQVRGQLTLDDGAAKVVRAHGKSVLPVGVVALSGQFKRGDMVVCVDQQQHEVARGLVNYDWDEAQRILRQPSTKIAEILGYVDDESLIHRDNLVVL